MYVTPSPGSVNKTPGTHWFVEFGFGEIMTLESLVSCLKEEMFADNFSHNSFIKGKYTRVTWREAALVSGVEF